MNASSKLGSALFCKTSISVRARESRESWVARTLVAANISSARCAAAAAPAPSSRTSPMAAIENRMTLPSLGVFEGGRR